MLTLLTNQLTTDLCRKQIHTSVKGQASHSCYTGRVTVHFYFGLISENANTVAYCRSCEVRHTTTNIVQIVRKAKKEQQQEELHSNIDKLSTEFDIYANSEHYSRVCQRVGCEQCKVPAFVFAM